MTLVDFVSEGHHYQIGLLEEKGVDTDPTLLLFRDDEEEGGIEPRGVEDLAEGLRPDQVHARVDEDHICTRGVHE